MGLSKARTTSMLTTWNGFDQPYVGINYYIQSCDREQPFNLDRRNRRSSVWAHRSMPNKFPVFKALREVAAASADLSDRRFQAGIKCYFQRVIMRWQK